jgi:DNA invertase Pin-like site-specific DNA recombinase
MSEQENSGHWLRVSSLKQDEQSQLPDIASWNDSHGYNHKATYEVHGASARKGNRKFDKAWSQVLEDFRTGKINTLIVWTLSRLDRKLAATQMIAQVVELGGKIEFVKQPHLNNLSTMGGRIALKVEEEIAFAESQEKSDRVKAKQSALRNEGSIPNGRPPWGYEVTKTDDGRKILTPTEQGRIWIPRIFKACADGMSIADIIRMASDGGLVTTRGKAQWHESYVAAKILRNPTYAGIRGTMEFEALVTMEEFQAAGKALDKRRRNTRGASVHPKVLLKPFCGNPDCNATRKNPDDLSPMYRMIAGPDGYKIPYYRCVGMGPARKGCGAPMVPCKDLDDIITDMFIKNGQPHEEPVFVPGDDISNDLAKLQEQIAAAARKGEYARISELTVKAQELEAAPRKPARWEMRKTDKTEGEVFEAMDAAERAAYLRDRWIIKASKLNGVLKWDMLPAEPR